MPGKKARLIDIARLSGVSIGTVDRVLHDRGEVAEKTRINVLRIAGELKYTPNVIAQVLKSKKIINLVSILPEPTIENSFWLNHPAGIKKAIAELDPFPVRLTQVTFDMLDETDFQRKSGKAISLSPDGVILAPIFKSESIAFCAQLKKRNIPFVFIDGFIQETDFLSYTGEDVFQSGKVAGQLVDLLTPADKDILIVNIAKNPQNVHHLSNRIHGFISYYERNGKSRRIKANYSIPDPDPDIIRKGLDKLLSKYTNLGTFFITGSKSYKIADYLMERGIKSINIVGYDLLERNVEHLKSGLIKFLIGQRPEEQTYIGVKKLFDYLSMNKKPKKMEYLPIDIVTSENVDFFIQ